MRLETLIGSPLKSVEACEPWAKALAPQGILAGAFVLTFGNDAAAVSLVCTSPLRHLHCQKGTIYGLASGDAVSLGYRLTVCGVPDTALLRNTATTAQWAPWTKLAHATTTQKLAGIDVTAERHGSNAACWGIDLAFASGQRIRLSYRADLDGCIELAMPGQHVEIDRITVDEPEQDFGWLHPAAPVSFILNDQVWRSAKVTDWPHALRKALQSQQAPEVLYRQTMRRALMTRFRQSPRLQQRLLALRYPVQVKDVPHGLIEEIAQAFRRPR